MMHHDPPRFCDRGIPKKSYMQYWKNLRGTRKKIYIYTAVTGLDVLTDVSVMTFETFKCIDRVCCNSGSLRNT